MRTRLNDRDSEVTNLCNTPGLAEHLHRYSGTPHDRGPTLLKGYGACLRYISCDEDFSSSHTSCLKERFSQNFRSIKQ